MALDMATWLNANWDTSLTPEENNRAYQRASRATAPGVPPPAAATPAAPAAEPSAKALLRSQLESGFGLGDLADWAWNLFTTQNASVEEIFALVPQQEAYKIRYPAMAELRAKNQGITEQAYQQYESGVRELLHAYGIPAGMYDSPTAIAQGLLGNVSVAEVKDRLDGATAASLSAPAEVREAMASYYGVAPGDLTAYWLNPDNAMPVIQKQYAAATIGGAARAQGLAGVSAATAEQIAATGLSAGQARQAFASVSPELGVALPGEDEALGPDVLALGAAGVGSAAQALARARRRRTAGFENGGQFAASNEGVSGIGVA